MTARWTRKVTSNATRRPASKHRRRRAQENEAIKRATRRRSLIKVAQGFKVYRTTGSKQKAASSAAPTERYLHIRNIPSNIKPMEVARHLATSIGVPIDCILRVEIQRTLRGPAALALVTVVSQGVADLIQGSLCLMMLGRVLQCSAAEFDASTNRHRDTHSAVFPARKLILRKDSQDPANDLNAGFVASDVLFELDSRNKRELGVEFGDFRVELGLKSLVYYEVRTIRASFGGGILVLRLILREPPICFRLVVPSRVNSQHKNPTVWELRPSGGVARSARWERTTDPSGGSAFAHCLLYDLVIDEIHRERLFEQLNRFRLYHEDPISAQVGLVMPQVTLPMKHDWSGGNDPIFEFLPFPVRYAMHAAIVGQKLVFINADEAKHVASALQQCTNTSHALRALQDLFHESQPTNSVRQLLANLFKRPNDECKNVVGDDVEFLPGTSECWCQIRRVLVTPLRVWPQLPEMDVSNRILRHFARFNERFARVTFVDEDVEPIFHAKSDCIDKSIRSLLDKGIIIAGNRYVFLAFSSSQLRVQSAWFYDEGPRFPNQMENVPTANEIRASMGDLSSISIVGKYAARLGQGFSSTTRGPKIGPSQYHTIPDVVRHGFTFSDGVGMISFSIARHVQDTLKLEHVPSAMQIRIRGSKGVVSLCPPGVSIPMGKQLLLRQSMNKFAGNPQHQELEICSIAKTMPCYLNRQVITVLSAMNVPDRVFIRLLREMIRDMQACMTSNEYAMAFLKRYARQSFVIRLLEAGYSVTEDRFLREWVAGVRNRVAHSLRTKARIYVLKGIVLMGIMDETCTLPSSQVFFQSRDPVRRMPQAGTTMAIGRNPCLHPGDIRLLKMADIEKFPWLGDLYDVLVFSALGARPQVNMMSGGDFDGDLYFAIWDPSIVCHTQEQPPMKYALAVSSPSAHSYMPFDFGSSPAVKNDQVKDFFVKFMQNDNIGQMSNAHMAFADSSDSGARSSEWIRLAGLHSTAVDFCKTGVAAELPRELTAKSYPHFMENGMKQSYQSRKVLGKIYDIAVEDDTPPNGRNISRFMGNGFVKGC